MPERRRENSLVILPILTRHYDGAEEGPPQWQGEPAGRIFSEIV